MAIVAVHPVAISVACDVCRNLDVAPHNVVDCIHTHTHTHTHTHIKYRLLARFEC